jgi:hypothetical protein
VFRDFAGVASTNGTTRAEHGDTNSAVSTAPLGATRRCPEHRLGRRWTLAPGRPVFYPAPLSTGLRSAHLRLYAVFSRVIGHQPFDGTAADAWGRGGCRGASRGGAASLKRHPSRFPCNQQRSKPMKNYGATANKWQRKSTVDATTSCWPTSRRTSPCKAASWSAGCARGQSRFLDETYEPFTFRNSFSRASSVRL